MFVEVYYFTSRLLVDQLHWSDWQFFYYFKQNAKQNFIIRLFPN